MRLSMTVRDSAVGHVFNVPVALGTLETCPTTAAGTNHSLVGGWGRGVTGNKSRVGRAVEMRNAPSLMLAGSAVASICAEVNP